MTRVVEPRFRPKSRRWPLMYAYLVECGGSSKTTSATSKAVIAAERGYPSTIFDLDSNMSTTKVLGYDETSLKGKKTVLDLIHCTASLDEVALPARYRIADGYGDEAFQTIPNLRVVPSCAAMSSADTAITEDIDRYDWFADVLRSYDGDDDMFFIDFPAGYGRMVYSVIRMLDEDDAVIPSVRADPKDINMIPGLIQELERVREKNRGRRSVPGRPTLKHMLLTGTPTASYKEAAARRATELAEAKYGSVLLPYVRYSADAKKLYEDACPLPVLLPNSVPAVDYRKVMTHLGFTGRT
ncbi:ParA family protein [Streptomyces sp. NBC_01465]|uniref:ParA family protein n=1 Tax=Streptomyces sp. NBC_01465 TaxID=2903878 RepID=UPI002E377B3F|nr:ParA family protein [Streptomyces sp. NBC_01465]